MVLMGISGVVTGKLDITFGLGGPGVLEDLDWKPWKKTSINRVGLTARLISVILLVGGLYLILLKS